MESIMRHISGMTRRLKYGPLVGGKPLGRIYRNSPISEVVCEFRFEPSVQWDPTVPGLMFQRLEHDFPLRRQNRTLEAGLLAGPNGLQQQFVMDERAQFFSKDEKSFVQVGRHYLSVNILEPYSSWDKYLPMIMSGLQAYREAIGTVSNLLRVGLRYVNNIKFSSAKVRLEDYFMFYPHTGDKLPETHSNLHMGLDFTFNGDRDILRLQLQTGPRESAEHVALLLDLDYFLGRPSDVPYDELSGWLDEAHSHIEEFFEGSITDSLRKMFGGVSGSND